MNSTVETLFYATVEQVAPLLPPPPPHLPASPSGSRRGPACRVYLSCVSRRLARAVPQWNTHQMSSRVRRAGAPEYASPGTSRRSSGRSSTASRRSSTEAKAALGDLRVPELDSSQSLPDIRSPDQRRIRPRPGRKLARAVRPPPGQLYGGQAGTLHPLGSNERGWKADPEFRTAGELWHARWQSKQPHPSFDVDGDGVISNLDYYLAKQFDKDNNGMLDRSEVRRMRTVLAKKGIETFAAMGHGPHIEKLTKQVNSNLLSASPRNLDATQGIDADSPEWHLKMSRLTNKTRSAAHYNSEEVATCLAHSAMDANNINMMDQLVNKGVHQMMGSGWRDEGHEDVFDADAGGWVDKKAGPKEVRDQDQDLVADQDGRHMRRGNPILDGFTDQPVVEDSVEVRLRQAGERIIDENTLLHVNEDIPKPKVGKLSKPDTRSLRKLFAQLDVDRSGTLDQNEVELMAAAGGKKMTKRQLFEAMAEMDRDGSGSIDYEEFEKWWVNGTMNPPQGTEVFRRISNQLECKFSNFRKVFRKFDDNKDGTLSQHEFSKGLSNCGIDLSDREFADLMLTLDEDGSNEIDCEQDHTCFNESVTKCHPRVLANVDNEFASSAIVGGKYFAARDPKGFSGCKTRKMLLDKRKRVERAFGQQKMDAFWGRVLVEPEISVAEITWQGGSGV